MYIVKQTKTVSLPVSDLDMHNLLKSLFYVCEKNSFINHQISFAISSTLICILSNVILHTHYLCHMKTFHCQFIGG